MINTKNKKIAFVTGGAGLVGSSLCERLLAQDYAVYCVDNFVLGTKKHLGNCLKNPKFFFFECDVGIEQWWQKESFLSWINSTHNTGGAEFCPEVVFHLAANSDISLGHRQPEMDYYRTLVTTFQTLQAVRYWNEFGKNRGHSPIHFVFSSSSAVYGADPVLPTPVETTKMYPVSIYGAGKLAAEHFISAFVENYGLRASVFRFGNVVGRRLTHGVIYDFVHKLIKNPTQLDVLGNGTQQKTYIDVEDCVSGILIGMQNNADQKNRFNIFNLSTQGTTTVRQIAQAVVAQMKLVTGKEAAINYGDASIGWVGDVPKTGLDVSAIESLGWKPRLTSEQAVQNAIAEFILWQKEGHAE